MKILEVNNVSKSFSNNKVINDISFSVEENEVIGFIGPNGAGKTTTMKMILGLLKVDSGTIKVDGKKVNSGYTETNKVVGYLPDVPEFYGYMRAKEYLIFCAEIVGIDKNEINERCNELLTIVGLEKCNKKISTFSRGMKQRLGIAQALINNPKLLICDEPTSALDPIGRKEILEILKKVREKTTVIFSTHILSDVERVCNSVLVLNKGNIVLNGQIQEIKEKYRINKLYISFETVKEKELFLNTAKFNVFEEGDTNLYITVNDKNIKKQILDELKNNNIFPVKMELMEPTIEEILMEAVK